MVVLGGVLFLMSEVTLYGPHPNNVSTTHPSTHARWARLRSMRIQQLNSLFRPSLCIEFRSPKTPLRGL